MITMGKCRSQGCAHAAAHTDGRCFEHAIGRVVDIFASAQSLLDAARKEIATLETALGQAEDDLNESRIKIEELIDAAADAIEAAS